MDILIKSFNRPYYLERCLKSIRQHVINTDYKITILDDGTPDIYLNKIKTDFPKVTILKSKAYTIKSESVYLGVEPENKSIPIDLWLEGTKRASEYFLLLEDDIWLTKTIDLSSMVGEMVSKNALFLKLFWLGNPKLIQSKIDQKGKNINFLIPKIPYYNSFLYKLIFYKFDKLKIRKTFKFLKIHTKLKDISYYSIYSVAGVLFKKSYFLSLWKNHNNKVDEKLQIYNALRFINNQNQKPGFARTKLEVAKTGFTSSATNRNYNEVNFDMFLFNQIINKAWFENLFNSMENFPNDFSDDYIQLFLSNTSIKISKKSWRKWKNSFKSEFKSFGCVIDE